MSSQFNTFPISADYVIFSGNNSGADGNIHLRADNTDAHLQFDNRIRCAKDIELKTKIADVSGGKIMELSADKSTVSHGKITKFEATIDFNNQTILNAPSLGGGGSLTTADIGSSNGYASADLELDNITTSLNTTKARTENLTTNKIMISNNAGILVAGTFAETDIVRKSVSTGQTLSGPLTIGGEVNIPSGESYKINSVALASANLTDGGVLMKTTADEIVSGDKTFTGDASFLGSGDIIMNKALIIEMYDMLGGGVVAGTNEEYTEVQGCIKKTNPIFLTNTKYTSNASNATSNDGGHGFLQCTATATGQIDATAEVVRADGGINQSIDGNKTFSSSLTVGSGSTNAFISAGGYVQLTTPSGTNSSIKFNKAGSVHTLTMNDLGTALDNLTFDANFNLTSGNHFKINQHQIQVSDLYDGDKVQKEDTDEMKLTDSTYTGFAVDAPSMNGGCGFLQVIEQTSGKITNSAKVVRADGGVVQSIDGAKTFTGVLTVQSNASNYVQIGTGGIVSLANSANTSGFQFGSPSLTLFENGDALRCSGNFNIATGKNYLINGTQITSGALSDSNVIVKNDQSNTYANTQTFNGSVIMGVSGGNASTTTYGESGSTQFSIGKTTGTSSSLDIHTDTTTADISFSLGSGGGLTIPLRITDDTVEASSSTDTEASLRYKTSSYAGSSATTPANEVVNRADVTAFLQSATTSNSVKLNIVEAGGGTGFDGSSTSLTINHLNPVKIQALKHVPDGSGGYQAHPAGTLNTFDVDCLCECNNGLTVSGASQNFLARGGVTNGDAIADVQILLNEMRTRSLTAWAPDFIDITASGGTVNLTSGLSISIQPSIIRTRYGTNGSGTAIYKVECRGRIQKTTGAFTANHTLFTFPSGYRPAIEQNYVCQAHIGTKQARVDVTTGGLCSLAIDGTDASVSFVNLGTLSFWTV